MTTECGFCKGTGIEPGFTECVWCENTGFEGVIQPGDIKRACSANKSANKVHRYKVVTMLSAAGATIGYDPHGPDVVMAAEFDRVTAERDALQALLTAAAEREDVLDGLLRKWLSQFPKPGVTGGPITTLKEETEKALSAKESGSHA